MMVNGVFSSVLAEQFDATQKFRKLLSIGACVVYANMGISMHDHACYTQSETRPSRR